MFDLANLNFFYQASKKPYFYDKSFIRERRFTSTIFNFGFSSLDKFFYVLLDVELKQYI
jgi:hypothetical protein